MLGKVSMESNLSLEDIFGIVPQLVFLKAFHVIYKASRILCRSMKMVTINEYYLMSLIYLPLLCWVFLCGVLVSCIFLYAKICCIWNTMTRFELLTGEIRNINT